MLFRSECRPDNRQEGAKVVDLEEFPEIERGVRGGDMREGRNALLEISADAFEREEEDDDKEG